MVNPNEFTWVRGKDYVKRFELDGAKDFATSFCLNCGSSLPWQAKSRKIVVIPAGTLDGDPGIKPNHLLPHLLKSN